LAINVPWAAALRFQDVGKNQEQEDRGQRAA
jgi:hypothetical protein